MTASVNNIGAMLSSMTDESFTLSAGGGSTNHDNSATHQNTTPNTNNSNTQRASKNATKILAMRMLQGYTPTPHNCLECNMPLMQSSDSGIVQCVVCLERQVILSTPNGSSSTSSSIYDNTCSEEEEEAKEEHRRQLVAEVDGILVATKSQRKERLLKGKTDIVTITDDGDIELRRLLTMESVESYSDILIVGTDSDDCGVVSYNSSSKSESDRTDGGGEGELVLPAFNSTNYPHLAQEMNERSALLAAKSQAAAVGYKKNRKNNKNVRLLEVIDELSAASSAKKQLGGAASTTQKMVPPTMIGEEQSSVGGSDKENSTHSPLKASRTSPKQIVDDSDNTSMMSVSQHNASIINDIDSTLISYQKGKAFATQIIQDTNGILDDLVSTEGGGGCGGDGTMSVSPSLMSDGYGKKMKKSSKGKAVDFDQQVKSVISSGGASVSGTTPTTPKRPPKKRLTINNISSEAHHGDRKKSYMPSWDNSKKNSAEKDGGDDDMLRGGAHDVSSVPLQSPLQANSPNVGEKDDFFSELRRKALLAKASATHEKLDADFGVTDETMMHIETGMNDDVSALESLPPFTPTNKSDGNMPKKPSSFGKLEAEKGEVTLPNSLVKSTALIGRDTTDEIQKHWQAANVRQLKQQQLQDEMSPAAANIQRKTTEAVSTRISTQPVVPDDEKVELALQSIREEKLALPFDEPVKLQNVASSPKMGLSTRNNVSASSATGRHNKTGIELVTVEECSSDEEVSSAAREKGQQRPGVSQADSIVSLSSSVQLQTQRLAQLEADALRKHQEAELAASTARTALEQMMQARNARKEKENKMKEQQEKEKQDNNDTDLSMCSTLSSLDKKAGKDSTKEITSSSQFSRRDSLVSNAEGSSPDGISSHESSDSTNNDSTIDTNTTSSTYLNRHRRALEERRRGRSRSLGRSRREEYSFYPTTPKTQNTRRVSRPPPLRVDDSSETSTSTSTNSTFDSISDTRPRTKRRPFGADSRRRTLSAPRGGRNNIGFKGSRSMAPNLLLPSLNSPDPSTPRTSSGRTPESAHHHHHRSRSKSPHHHNGTSIQQEYAPNYPANNMHMPSPYSQQPMMTYNHCSPGGQSGSVSPFPSRQQYSPSMATRMAKMMLDTDTSRRYSPATNRNVNVGLPPHHTYGQSKTPKSLREQSFGFNSCAQQERNVGGIHHSIQSRNFDSLSLAHNQTVRERMNPSNPYSTRMMGYSNMKDSSSYHPTMNSTHHKVRFTNNHLEYPQRHQFVSSMLPTNYESRNDYPTR